MAADDRNYELRGIKVFAYGTSTTRLTPALDAAPNSAGWISGTVISARRLTAAADGPLDDDGGISGTVTAAASGARLGNVNVEVFGSSDGEPGSASTGPDGTYTVTGLAPARDYSVCFDASNATGGNSGTGYTSQCYHNVPWAGGYSPAPGATPVPVTAGRLTPAVNAALYATGGAQGLTARVTSSASLSCGHMPTAGRHGATVPAARATATPMAAALSKVSTTPRRSGSSSASAPASTAYCHG
jgi:Carboxypeptidase regulatory-like domain